MFQLCHYNSQYITCQVNIYKLHKFLHNAMNMVIIYVITNLQDEVIA